MAESEKNSKYFFRTEKLPASAAAALPEDLQWAATEGTDAEIRRAAARAGAGNPLTSGTGTPIDNYDEYYNDGTGGPRIPQILGIVNQYVSQDPQGQGTINVVLRVTDDPAVDVEVRFTR